MDPRAPRSPLRPSAIPVASVARLLALALPWLALGACGPGPGPAPVTATWIAGRAEPAFEPDGPPDALRWALERQLSYGLVERDSSGHLRRALADSIGCSPDSLSWTFRLREGARFTDGTSVTSAHVRDALLAGLARPDHATRAWLLAAVRGVGRVRAGRALPVLGVDTPDPRRLVLHLEARDGRLLEKLSLPGVSTPWKRRSGSWAEAVGLGPYRVAGAEEGRSLTLVAAAAPPLADTLRVRFAIGAARVRSILRLAHPDFVWPLPPGLLAQPLPAGWEVERRVAVPGRRLLLVLRADVPPLTRADVRLALARTVNREELLASLGAGGAPLRRWLPGASEAYEWPPFGTGAEFAAPDAAPAPEPLRRGERAGERRASFHFVLAYDADLAGAEIARALQGQWARAGHYAELRPLRGPAAAAQALAAAAAQAQLVESQALLTGAEAELAQLVMPLRGPAVGGYRTGWRTREFDRWVAAPEPAPGFDADAAQRRLAADRVVLPLAALPWQMAFRNGGVRPRVHPAFGPEWGAVNSAGGDERTR